MAKLIDLRLELIQMQELVLLYCKVQKEMTSARIQFPNVKFETIRDILYDKHGIDQSFMTTMSIWEIQAISDSIRYNKK